MELTQRLHDMLEFLANDRLGADEFVLELDRLEEHYAQKLELVAGLQFSPDYMEGKTLQEHFRLQTERLFEALDWMRDCFLATIARAPVSSICTSHTLHRGWRTLRLAPAPHASRICSIIS